MQNYTAHWWGKAPAPLWLAHWRTSWERPEPSFASPWNGSNGRISTTTLWFLSRTLRSCVKAGYACTLLVCAGIYSYVLVHAVPFAARAIACCMGNPIPVTIQRLGSTYMQTVSNGFGLTSIYPSHDPRAFPVRKLYVCQLTKNTGGVVSQLFLIVYHGSDSA